MFHNCKDLEEIKKLYHRLSMHLHPDKGGEHDLMILLNECYELAKTCQEIGEDDSYVRFNTPKRKYSNSYEDVYEGNPSLEILVEIFKYSKKHSKFKIDYTESVCEFLQENGFITSNQYNSLVKIYYSFRMDKEND